MDETQTTYVALGGKSYREISVTCSEYHNFAQWVRTTAVFYRRWVMGLGQWLHDSTVHKNRGHW